MTRWLHDLDALKAWVHDPDAGVRRWAAGRWMAIYPHTDLEHLAPRLMDADPELQCDVAICLARSGEPRWAPVLLKGLELMEGRGRLGMIEALGVLGHPSAVPALVEVFREAGDGEELVAAVRALGRFRVQGAWTALTPLLDLLTEDDAFSATLIHLLLDMGRRGDVAGLLERWRRYARSETPGIAGAWLSWLGLSEGHVEELMGVVQCGPEAVLGRVASLDDLEGVAPGLDAAFAEGPRTAVRALYRALTTLLSARRDDPGRWLDEDLDVPARDYRALVVGAEALLAAMASVPPVANEPEELAVALGAYLAVLRRRDERAALAGDDPIRAAVDAVSRGCGHVPATAESVLLQAGSAGVEALLDLVDHTMDVDVVRATARLLARLPASRGAARAGPVLARRLLEERPTEVLDELIGATVAVGGAAVRGLVAALGPTPPEALLRALGELPTEESFSALTAVLVHDGAVDLAVAEALTNLGDVRAIDLLSAVWRPGMTPLTAMLEALCTLHDHEHPRRDEWRQELQLREGRAAFTGAALAREPAES